MLANPTTSVNCSKPLKFTAAGLVSPRQTEDLSNCSRVVRAVRFLADFKRFARPLSRSVDCQC
jgi:hypothetical protein